MALDNFAERILITVSQPPHQLLLAATARRPFPTAVAGRTDPGALRLDCCRLTM